MESDHKARWHEHHDPIPPCKIAKSSYIVPFGCHADGILARQMTACVKFCFSLLVRDLHSRRTAGFLQGGNVVVVLVPERRWTRETVTVMRLMMVSTAYTGTKLVLLSWISCGSILYARAGMFVLGLDSGISLLLVWRVCHRRISPFV